MFYATIKGMFPGAEDVMETINMCWNDKANHHSWVMPDGHTVYVPIVGVKNGMYGDPELGDIPLRFYKQTNSDNFRSLCPNVIHSIDGYIAREMIRRCNFQLVHIHDCFRFSPDHLQKVVKTYKEIMAEIAKSNLLQDIIIEITGNHKIVLSKYSYDLHKDIMGSNYMLS